MRLIDADAVIKNALTDTEREYLKSIAKTAPTIDAVPVVRCGDCKYLMANGICNMFADDTIKPSASDFCSCGERRNNEID